MTGMAPTPTSTDPGAAVDAGSPRGQRQPAPVLSVAIPTFNRAETLRRQLGSLLGQIVGCGADVEVVVSDNASSDATRAVVDQMRSRFPDLRYVRNDTNVGLLRNVDRAVRACRAEYVWIVGDDDVLMPYGVETVIGAVRRAAEGPDPAAFVFLNEFPVAADNTWVGASREAPSLPSDVKVDSSVLFLSFDITWFGHITRLVVRRPDWMALPFEVDGPWAAYGFLKNLMAICRNRTAYFVRAPVVGGRNKHSVTYYMNRLTMSYCIELPSYDLTLLNEWGISRRDVARVQRRRWRPTYRAWVKINLFEEYAPYWPQVDSIPLLTPEGKAVRFATRVLLRNRPWTHRIRGRFESRLQAPIASDPALHDLV